MFRIVFLTFFLVLNACADQYTAFHSRTGEPIFLSRRAYSAEGCLAVLREEADRLGVTYRYIHVKGSLVGMSLLWPFDKGYACEASIGPERGLSGIYPLTSVLLPHN